MSIKLALILLVISLVMIDDFLPAGTERLKLSILAVDILGGSKRPLFQLRMIALFQNVLSIQNWEVPTDR